MNKTLSKALIIGLIVVVWLVLTAVLNTNLTSTGRAHSLTWLPFVCMIYGIYKVIRHKG